MKLTVSSKNYKTIFLLNLILLMLLNISLVPSLQASEQLYTPHEQWLKNQFSKQHQELTPIVMVANIFFACNNAKKYSPVPYSMKQLMTKMSRDTLAENTVSCLGNNDMQSEQAVNFALQGCFNDTFIHLPEKEKAAKLVAVNTALGSLSLVERKKSLTSCLTLQAIKYVE